MPLVVGGRLYGIVVLDFGREGTEHASGRLVPLLTMAQQAAIRLQSRHAGVVVEEFLESAPVGIRAPASPELELRCFGPFAVYQQGRAVPAEAFTRSKALVLLKLLALKAGAPVHRDVLMEQLWPEVDPRSGANRLHGVVHALRVVIEPHGADRQWLYVRNRGEFYYLDMDAPIDIDLVRFRLLLTQGRCASLARAAEAITCFEQAVELYRGDLFEDDPFAEWCQAERRELKDGYLQALERLAHLHSEQGDAEKALGYLRRASHSSPFREDLLVAQMKLLAQLARSNEALVVFDDYQRRLAEEMGTTPSADLRAFHRRLLSSDRGADRDTAATDPSRQGSAVGRAAS